MLNITHGSEPITSFCTMLHAPSHFFTGQYQLLALPSFTTQPNDFSIVTFIIVCPANDSGTPHRGPT